MSTHQRPVYHLEIIRYTAQTRQSKIADFDHTPVRKHGQRLVNYDVNYSLFASTAKLRYYYD